MVTRGDAPIQLVILSRNASLYSTQRLREAAEERGHDVRVINYLRCVIDIASHRPAIIYSGRRLTGGRSHRDAGGDVEADEQQIDAIIPRIGASRTFYGTAVVRQFEMMGVYAANESQAISRSRDKLRALQLLAAEGVGLPVTSFAHSTKDVAGVIKLVGGPPLVIKLLEGTQGMGVVLAETRKAAESVIGAFRQLDANILVQEYIKEAQGSDIRAFVVGKRVVAAMERRAAAGEFRSNVHRGGSTDKVRLTPEERATAKRAARILGLNVAGVDLMRSNHGPVVLEVNSSPGLEGIEGATGVDVAGAIIQFLEKNARPGRLRTRGTRG